MRSENTLFNIRISLYGFIMTVAVIWIHAVEPALAAGSSLASDNFALRTAEYLLGNVLGQLAVPGFFCLSGYLFFRNCDLSMSTATAASFFRNKLTKRVYSLVLPYVLWNLIYYIIYLAAGRAAFNASAIFNAVINYGYNPVFWYLHELILIMVITPLIYVLLKTKAVAVPVLAAIYALAVFYELIPIHYVNEDALLYFCAGAAASMHLKKYEDRLEYIGRLGASCFLIFVICTELTAKLYGYGYMAALIGGRLSGLIAVFATVCVSVRREKKLPAFTGYNFFIYAVHYLEIRLFQGVFDALSQSLCGLSLFDNNMLSTVLYICMPLMCIVLAVSLGRMMRKMFPGLYALLTGGRQKSDGLQSCEIQS